MCRLLAVLRSPPSRHPSPDRGTANCCPTRRASPYQSHKPCAPPQLPELILRDRKSTASAFPPSPSPAKQSVFPCAGKSRMNRRLTCLQSSSTNLNGLTGSASDREGATPQATAGGHQSPQKEESGG